MDTLDLIALTRTRVIVAKGEIAKPQEIAAFAAEMAHVGVKLINSENVTAELVASSGQLIREIRKMRGQKSTYVPLFSGFPEQLPDWDDAKLRFGWALQRLGGNLNPTEEELRDALNFEDINWWPASSIPQKNEDLEKGQGFEAVKPSDSRVEWLKFTVVSEEERNSTLRNYLHDVMSANASLPEDVRPDVEKLIEHFGAQTVSLDEVPFREKKIFLLKHLWVNDLSALKASKASPTDLLRLMADLTGGDVSLTEKIRYPKLKRAQRRALVNTLENSGRLSEIFRYRDLWLKLDKGLHLGEFNAPLTQDAFSRLRESDRDSTSVNSRLEALLSENNLTEAFSLLLQEAPGVLLRQIRRLAHLANQTGEEARTQLVATVEQLTAKVPLRVLLAAKAQIADNGQTYPRVAFTKKGGALTIDKDPGHLQIGKKFQQQLLQALLKTSHTILAGKTSWKDEKIFIEDGLDKLLLPDQLRSSNKGLVQAERGSRIPVGEDVKVIRLFTYWKQTSYSTDLDLSAMMFDENFNYAGHVSWTRLADGAAVHSGDITSAPNGASEFIDIDIDKMSRKNKQVRYVAIAILRYSGESFDDLAEVTAGWMKRSEASSSFKAFDPATVADAFELKGKMRYAVPFLFDLKEKEVLFVNTYLPGANAITVESDATAASLKGLASMLSDRINFKANVEELVLLNVKARGGELVKTREEATISFGTDEENTFNVLRPEAALAELL